MRHQDENETLFFERTYEVPASGRVEESEMIFTDWSGGECIAEVTTESGWSASADVSVVAENSWNYGIRVDLSKDVGNLAVYDFHVDPGTSVNPSCLR